MANNEKMAPITGKDDIKIELATKPALRLWKGREKTAKRFGILGIPGFSKIMRGIEDAVRADDPYADYHYHQVELGLDDLAFDLDNELKDIKSYIDENVPSAMRLPDVGSKEPVVVPVRFASRLGFRLVYELLKADKIIMKVLLANHIGLLPNDDKWKTLARIEKSIRRVMQMVFTYKHTGVTRDDMAANNQKAQQARKAMGDLEPGYLDGSTRSANAPALPTNRLKTIREEISTASSPDNDGDEVPDLTAELDRVLEGDPDLGEKTRDTAPSDKAAQEKPRSTRRRTAASA